MKTPPEKQFIAFERLDNSSGDNKTGYDKRYLDALASVLLVDKGGKGNKDKNTVAAVIHYKEKFYLSYNKTPIKDVLQIIRSIWLNVVKNELTQVLLYHLRSNQIDFAQVVNNLIKAKYFDEVNENYYYHNITTIDWKIKTYINVLSKIFISQKIGENILQKVNYCIFSNKYSELEKKQFLPQEVSNEEQGEAIKKKSKVSWINRTVGKS
jgi:hypothetical protein